MNQINFYLLRHGESTWNIEKRCQGQKNDVKIPLSENGIADAKTVYSRLKDKNISAIFSSDLLRAKQTAEIIANDLKLSIEYNENLRETNFGDAQGLLPNEIEKNYPDFNEAKTDHTKHFPNGESLNETRKRIENFLEKIIEETSEQNILISAHGSIIGNFLGKITNQNFVKLGNVNIAHVIYNRVENKFYYKGLI